VLISPSVLRPYLLRTELFIAIKSLFGSAALAVRCVVVKPYSCSSFVCGTKGPLEFHSGAQVMHDRLFLSNTRPKAGQVINYNCWALVTVLQLLMVGMLYFADLDFHIMMSASCNIKPPVLESLTL
jgi:hypothetical protein